VDARAGKARRSSEEKRPEQDLFYTRWPSFRAPIGLPRTTLVIRDVSDGNKVWRTIDEVGCPRTSALHFGTAWRSHFACHHFPSMREVPFRAG
jgi:hypothetical protein